MTKGVWDLTQDRTFAVVEAFKGYPNTLGFFAGNEIINDVPTSKANPPFIRVSSGRTESLIHPC